MTGALGVAHAQPADDRIHQALSHLERGYAAGDPESVTTVMTDDAILLAPGAEQVRGRAAVRKRYAAYFDARGAVELRLEPEETRAADDWAAVRGTMWGRRVAADAGARGLAGKFMMILERQPDGSWKVASLIWNDDPKHE